MTTATEYNINLLHLVKSIRTTGCLAKIIIFTSNKVIFPQSLMLCGIEQIMNISDRFLKSPYKARWECYYTYLKQNRHKYDRIMHVDGYDSFFFGDPFSYAFDAETLYFQSEGRPIESCPYNKRWVFECHKNVRKNLFGLNIILCSGSLIGGVNPFLLFVEKLITHNEWNQCWGIGYDQGDFNYVFYSDWERNKSIRYKTKLMGCNDRFVTMHYCIRPNNLYKNNRGQICTKDQKDTVAFMHQYTRFPEMNHYVQSICNI